MTTHVRIIFYSMYGHIHRLAEAVADGARMVSDVEVALAQVPEVISDQILEQMGAKTARARFAHIPLAKATIWLAPTRLSLAHPLALAIRAARCATISIRPADYGRKTSWWER
jgi:hypothetical protein